MRKSFLLLGLLGVVSVRAADHLSIAAAANLVSTLETLDTAFRQAHPEITVTTAAGASGNLVTQIRNGAPFDVFLSADLEFPGQLIAWGEADPDTLTPFAVGKLVVWTTKPGIVLTSVSDLFRDSTVHKVAIANPKTAPYGRAAAQALAKLGLTAAAEPKLVYGENIAQTTQFAETGNADAAFVALSLVIAPELKEKGRWMVVPENLYVPLEQGAIVTKHGAGNAAATLYLHFLREPAARKILTDAGYGVPP